MDFRKKFQDILESSYITCQVNETSAWHDIYKLLLPNIPEKLFDIVEWISPAILLNRLGRGLFHYAMQGCFQINMIHICI